LPGITNTVIHRLLAPTACLAVAGLLAIACASAGPSTPLVTPAAPTSGATAPPTPSVVSTTATPSAPATATPGATAAAALTGPLSGPVIGPRPAPPLEDLINPDGSAFELTAYAGSPTLLFFGYTHCPDVCPATIGEIFGVFETAPETQAVFVSVDPERDTPEWLAKWTEYMPQSFNAVTGSPGAIRRAADGYGVRYARVETSSKAGYTMSHTADLFLIDAAGQLVHSFPFGTPAADIAAGIAESQAG
jgi:protein SCO1/2